jgi:hypothetical protein
MTFLTPRSEAMARVPGRDETTVAGGEAVRAFSPYPLPPSDPPLDMTRLHLRTARGGPPLGWVPTGVVVPFDPADPVAVSLASLQGEGEA